MIHNMIFRNKTADKYRQACKKINKLEHKMENTSLFEDRKRDNLKLKIANARADKNAAYLELRYGPKTNVKNTTTSINFSSENKSRQNSVHFHGHLHKENTHKLKKR